MTTSSPPVGILGLGFGRAHIPAFQAHGGQVVALCQRDQVVSHVFPLERISEGFREADVKQRQGAAVPVSRAAVALV